MEIPLGHDRIGTPDMERVRVMCQGGHPYLVESHPQAPVHKHRLKLEAARTLFSASAESFLVKIYCFRCQDMFCRMPWTIGAPDFWGTDRKTYGVEIPD